MPPAYDLRRRRFRRGPSMSRQDRWRNDFDTRPLQQHRIMGEFVGDEAEWCLAGKMVPRWNQERGVARLYPLGHGPFHPARAACNDRPRRRDVINLTGVRVDGGGGAQLA